MSENEITGEAFDVFVKVHRVLGPGLYESVYEAAIKHELSLREIPFKSQVGVSVIYEGVKLD